MDKIKVLLILLVVLVLASAGSLYDSPSASAQAETSGEEPFLYFLKIDGIEGGATHPQHEDEIDILSSSWGETSAGAPSVGGAGQGRAAIEDIYFTAPLSKASPKLMQSVPQGSRFKEAVFTIVEAAGSEYVLLEVKLEDVSVTSYHVSSVGDRPTESFSLNFGKIAYTYYLYNDQGELDGIFEGSWNLKTNTP